MATLEGLGLGYRDLVGWGPVAAAQPEPPQALAGSSGKARAPLAAPGCATAVLPSV